VKHSSWSAQAAIVGTSAARPVSRPFDFLGPRKPRPALAEGQGEALEGEPYSTVSLTSMLLRVALE
jgi:hypothetical protein